MFSKEKGLMLKWNKSIGTQTRQNYRDYNLKDKTI